MTPPPGQSTGAGHLTAAMARADERTVLDGPLVPRVLAILTVGLLAARLSPVGADLAINGLCAVAFGAWLMLRRRCPAWVGPVLGVALMGFGILASPESVDVRTITGTTVLLLSLPVRWSFTLIVIGWILSTTGRAGDEGPFAIIVAIGQSLLVAVVLCLLELTAQTTEELQNARGELLEERMQEERLRLGHQVRSLLGRTFATAQHHLDAARTHVRDADLDGELQEVGGILGDGREQLGRLTFEAQQTSFPEELLAVREVCDRLGVDLTLSIDDIPEREISDAAALVLREAMTNLLKHADPTRCVIAVRRSDSETVLAITNNGVRASAPASDAGTGHRRWRESLRPMGAHLDAGPLSDGRYRVTVHFPTGG